MIYSQIYQGNALEILKTFPDESINCVMTSPPYWALRDYKTEGQIGLEPTFDLYIEHLCDIFDEVKRILKKDGTCWVNLGDTYYGGNGGLNKWERDKGLSWKDNSERHTKPQWQRPSREAFKEVGINKKCLQCGKEIKTGNNGQFCSRECLNKQGNDFRSQNRLLPNKTLTMIPFRFAIEMVNRGWILRNNIIWYKPNCMPSSVKDRFTIDFEYLFFFVKNKKYYFETQYEPHTSKIIEKFKPRARDSKLINSSIQPRSGTAFANPYNPRGRNKRTVWTICPKPFKESHFAVYPEELCEIPIKSGCPEFICNKCGKPKILFQQIEKQKKELTRESKKILLVRPDGYSRPPTDWKASKIISEKYKSQCDCNVGFSGGIVLDPFFGSGTTGLVALKQKKNFIGIELNPEYIKIAENRLKPFLEQKTLQEVTNPNSSQV